MLQVHTWGCNDEGALGRQTTSEEENFVSGAVQIDGKVVQITAGDCCTAALTDDGRVFAWGCFRVIMMLDLIHFCYDNGNLFIHMVYILCE